MIKSRTAFTLIEALVCTLVLAVTTIGVVAVSGRVNIMKTESRNVVFLSIHNLNIMEHTRQESYESPPGEQLLRYYGEEETRLWTTDSNVRSEVYVDAAKLGNYNVYRIKVVTKMVGYKQSLTSIYTFTDIGKPYRVYAEAGMV